MLYELSMQPFRLTIAQPCQQDWSSMTGSEKRRHCASCDNDVVALAEMMPEDALALVRAAKPHSLCLRIEHDDDGKVIFRKNAAQTQANLMPLLVLTVGTSLLLPACDEPASTAPVPVIEKAPATQSVDHVEPAATETKSPTAVDSASAKPFHAGAPTAASAEANPPRGAHDRLAKPQNRPTTRVTTGCVCAVGDKLCDCL